MLCRHRLDGKSKPQRLRRLDENWRHEMAIIAEANCLI